MKRNFFIAVFMVFFIYSAAFGQGFVDNGDGTVTDTGTGLMWQKETASERTWEESITYCENLTLAGKNDWRLPNRIELQSLVDYNQDEPAIDTKFFPDTASSVYWSSTTHAFNTVSAWYVYFGFGHVSGSNKSNSYCVRAVRGGL